MQLLSTEPTTTSGRQKALNKYIQLPFMEVLLYSTLVIVTFLTCIQSPGNFAIWWVLIQLFWGIDDTGHTLRKKKLDSSG